MKLKQSCLMCNMHCEFEDGNRIPDCAECKYSPKSFKFCRKCRGISEVRTCKFEEVVNNGK